MKILLLAVIFSCLPFASGAQASGTIEADPGFALIAGLRFGQKDINENTVGFGGAKLDWLFWGDDTRLSFAAPSLNFQTDATFAPAISPLTVIMRTHFTFGIEIFPINSNNQKGGTFGLSVGFRFE